MEKLVDEEVKAGIEDMAPLLRTATPRNVVVHCGHMLGLGMHISGPDLAGMSGLRRPLAKVPQLLRTSAALDARPLSFHFVALLF